MLAWTKAAAVGELKSPIPGDILKVEQIGFSAGLTQGCERKRGVKQDTKAGESRKLDLR